MQYEFTKAFRKDFEKLKNKELAPLILTAIETVSTAQDSRDIPNLKKLTGHKNAYRIRIGNYRIGLFITGTSATFAVIDDRKTIYRRFP